LRILRKLNMKYLNLRIFLQPLSLLLLKNGFNNSYRNAFSWFINRILRLAYSTINAVAKPNILLHCTLTYIGTLGHCNIRYISTTSHCTRNAYTHHVSLHPSRIHAPCVTGCSPIYRCTVRRRNPRKKWTISHCTLTHICTICHCSLVQCAPYCTLPGVSYMYSLMFYLIIWWGQIKGKANRMHSLGFPQAPRPGRGGQTRLSLGFRSFTK